MSKLVCRLAYNDDVAAMTARARQYKVLVAERSKSIKKVVPKGPSESSPVRRGGCWVCVFGSDAFCQGRWSSSHPVKRCKKPHVIVSIVPPGRTDVICPNPAINYWATFTGSLRDSLNSRVLCCAPSLKLTRMSGCRISHVRHGGAPPVRQSGSDCLAWPAAHFEPQ
jgi:hypothetical protein